MYGDQKITLIKNDLMVCDWSDGDIVLLNSTCFSRDLMRKISVLAKKLKENAIVVCISKKIEGDEFVMLEKIERHMTWGVATLYFFKKI